MHTTERGRLGEARALEFLLDRGYAIVEQNYRCVVGELDLVAREGGDLVFIEVRSRADELHGDASFAVGPGKQHRVARVAEFYLGDRRPSFATCRFDVVAITGERVELFRDAFRIGLK